MHSVYNCLNNLFSSTAWVSRYQKDKTSLDLNEARDDGVSGMQWHQLDHMQTICTSLQTGNHNNTSSLIFWSDAHPDAQQTASKHWRHIEKNKRMTTMNKWYVGLKPRAPWIQTPRHTCTASCESFWSSWTCCAKCQRCESANRYSQFSYSLAFIYSVVQKRPKQRYYKLACNSAKCQPFLKLSPYAAENSQWN